MNIEVTVKRFLYKKKYYISAEAKGRTINIHLDIENDVKQESIDYLLAHIRKMLEHEMTIP